MKGVLFVEGESSLFLFGSDIGGQLHLHFFIQHTIITIHHISKYYKPNGSRKIISNDHIYSICVFQRVDAVFYQSRTFNQFVSAHINIYGEGSVNL